MYQHKCVFVMLWLYQRAGRVYYFNSVMMTYCYNLCWPCNVHLSLWWWDDKTHFDSLSLSMTVTNVSDDDHILVSSADYVHPLLAAFNQHRFSFTVNRFPKWAILYIYSAISGLDLLPLSVSHSDSFNHAALAVLTVHCSHLLLSESWQNRTQCSNTKRKMGNSGNYNHFRPGDEPWRMFGKHERLSSAWLQPSWFFIGGW